MRIGKEAFGKLAGGEEVNLFIFTSESGFTARVTEYGGCLVSLLVPDKRGNPADVVLGYDSLEEYLRDKYYFGAVIGRYANRIGKARFFLDGREYILTANEKGNTLHGGNKGFDKVLWKSTLFESESEAGIAFSYLSGDGEEGFPGNVSVDVKYTFTEDFRFDIEYSAKTDKTTHINLTQHSYFNLTGGRRDILDHEIKINSDRITDADSSLIPNGNILDNEGTAFDLKDFRNIGGQLKKLKTSGFDHNFIINKKTDDLEPAAEVREPERGLSLEVHTTEPALQFYSGNYLDGVRGKAGAVYKRHWGFCLETQHYPDSPNHPQFPSTLLLPGEVFYSQTVYQFKRNQDGQ